MPSLTATNSIRILCNQSRQLPTFQLFTLFNTIYAMKETALVIVERDDAHITRFNFYSVVTDEIS